MSDGGAGAPGARRARAQLLQEVADLRARLAAADQELSSAPQAPAPLTQGPEWMRGNEAILRTILESSRDGINMVDLRCGSYVFMNSAQVRLTGFTAEELRDLPVEEAYERVHPEDREISVSQQRRVAAGEDSGAPAEYRWKVKSGEYRWFEDSRRLIRDAQGRPIALVGVSRDITERKQAEQALRESEARFRSMLETSLDAAYRRNLQTDSYEYLSPVFERLTGVSVEAMKSMGIAEVLERIHPDDRAQVAKDVERANQEGTGRLRYRFLCREGKYRWLADYVVVLKDERGRPLSRSGVVRDVTERMEMEETLRQAQARTQAAERAAGAGTWDWDVRTGRLEWSATLYELFGLDPQRSPASFETWNAVLHPEDREAANRCIQEALSNHKDLASEYRILRPDGQMLWIEAAGRGHYDRDGLAVRMNGICVDISARRRAEEALSVAVQRAEQANRAKSEFLAHMSHELRTPLSAIIGLSEVLMPRLATEEKREFLGLIRESAQSLLAVIGDVLDLSRIEAGRVEVCSGEFSPREVLQSLVAASSLRAADKGLELSLSVGPGVPPRLVGDAGLMGQVLRNLLSNAIKYTEKGSVRVSASALAAVDGRWQLSVRVTDTGIGIPSSRQHMLFESFARLHASSTTRSSIEGTGLGLAISRKLVELMGGEIGVESTEGIGSTFWFTLPLDPAPTTSDRPETRPAADKAPALALHALPPLRVLIVEDNLMNRRFLQTAFADAGHRVESVEDGSQALEAVQRNSFHLVLMDAQLPRMDGLEATRQIRLLSGPAGRVPIIALTAFAIKGDESRFLAAGMDAYLAKPVDFGRLAAEIRRVCGLES